MRHTTARSLGLAVAVVASTGALGLGTLPAQAAGAATAPSAPGALAARDVVAGARAALGAHPAAARTTAARGAAGQPVEPELVPVDTVVDDDGSTHVRFQRTYAGLPVRGGDVVVHQGPADQWRGTSQTLGAPLALATRPTLAASGATSRALAAEPLARAVDGLRAQGTPRLVIDALGSSPRLAWEVTTLGRRDDATPSRVTSSVDATTGAVLRTEEHVMTVDGSGKSLYSGTVPLDLTSKGSSFEMRDASRGGTYTVDVANRTDSMLCTLFRSGCATGPVLTSTDTSFGTGTTANRESAAVDAQYGTDATWDYYLTVHGRNGIFGTGKGSYNRVHYGRNYVNAFWDGTKMTYGDGDGASYGPLVSLDVAGHEMSHGVTENTAGLTYSGESGGLNEATSDIFGTMVEFYENNAADPGDYLIGEEFDLAEHQGFRRMDNPISDGSSPSCYSANTKNLDVHYSSGVGNHFFYLLAEGSGARTINGTVHDSPTCNASTVTGIGRDAAQRIWFRALTVYMTSGTTYAGARTATLNAASDLYGASSTQRAAVAKAWSAVSVG